MPKSLGPYGTFHNMLIFYYDRLLATYSALKLEDHSLSTVHYSLLIVFTATLYPPYLETISAATRGLAMMWCKGTCLT